jgi:hypothetical protein
MSPLIFIVFVLVVIIVTQKIVCHCTILTDLNTHQFIGFREVVNGACLHSHMKEIAMSKNFV